MRPNIEQRAWAVRVRHARRYHERKVARVARRSYDSRKLVHAGYVHADFHRLVNVLDKRGRVGTARPRALVEQNEHWPRERQRG